MPLTEFAPLTKNLSTAILPANRTELAKLAESSRMLCYQYQSAVGAAKTG
ncbi:MAG: hypothetical protein U7126_06920 [Microcoleus sp.]